MRTAAITLALGASLFTQFNYGQSSPALNGSYFLEERGAQAQSAQPYRVAGLIQLDGQGGAAGTEYLKEANRLTMRAVKGAYEIGANGLGVLTLRYDAVDDNGDTQTAASNYRLVVSSTGSISLLRTDAGVLADGALIPAATAAANLSGAYVVSEARSGLQPGLALAVWNIDSNGMVTARIFMRTFYEAGEAVLGGQLEPQADGSFNVRLSAPVRTNEEGETTSGGALNYKLVPAGNSFDLLRIDDGGISEITVSAK